MVIEFKDDCGTLTACGGQPSGKYNYTHACLSMTALGGVCSEGSPQNLQLSGSGAGTLDFTNTSISQDVSWDVTGTVTLPSTCTLKGIPIPIWKSCDKIGPKVEQMAGFKGLTCTNGANSSVCSCTINQKSSSKATGTLKSSTFTLTDADGTTTYNFCLQNGSLQYQEVNKTESVYTVKQ